MTNEAELAALLGERVTITNAHVRSSWTGKLIGYHYDPGMLIETDGGRVMCLPQSFSIERASREMTLGLTDPDARAPVVGLIDPDCRDGKHTSCVGGPCECQCHKPDDGGFS